MAELAQHSDDVKKPSPSADSVANSQKSAEISDESVAEKPALAPNVELSGEMQEGGFENAQWLVQRDGRFIQITELLYRLLEQIDGQRDLEAIAAGVSEATGKNVSANNVRTLLAKNLIPKGLVLKADGTAVEPTGEGVRSPLAVKMRMAMIDARFIRPITNVLQILYKPVILIGVMILVAVAQGWLFFVHGVAQSTQAALKEPGLLLILFAIIVLSAAFHEFGHASALEYGGGKVRGMGAGIYLMYPAFYTDVTDNYRLPRWSRVRTDLGGFYFNLIFALAMMGLYMLTGHEFLLLAILLLDLEIIHQSLPFVRLDGYWALADLTGVPDFFSQIGPYLRTVLPLPWWKGPKLPPYKRWVKFVFGAYILITIPLLAFLLFTMIKSVPRVLATAWESFGEQRVGLSQAYTAGDILGILSGVVQIITLALPTLGLIYVLYSLGRRAITALWNWSKPTPLRRGIGTLGSIAAVALLAYLWAPQLPWDPQSSGPLYAKGQFVPIRPEERGTVGDAINDIPVMRSFVPANFTTEGNPNPVVATAAPEATAVGDPAKTPTPDATGTVSSVGTTVEPEASTTAGATATARTTATPSATGSTTTAGTTATPSATGRTTASPTLEATAPSSTRTTAPAVATARPTVAPTTAPTTAPTSAPTTAPTSAPTNEPTSVPTTTPTVLPTALPTASPTVVPVDAGTTTVPAVPQNNANAADTVTPAP